jgi:myo-inositol-1(or 4)-monophosphatase
LDPVRSELYTAVKGKGALQNDAPIRASTCVRIDDALVGAAFPPSGNPKLAACLPVFAALATRCAGVHRSGACALDLAYVAAGRLDGFWMTGLRPSEVAAGALIVREAGGRVGDLAGGGDVLRANDVIAAAPGVFNALRETIAAAAPPR